MTYDDIRRMPTSVPRDYFAIHDSSGMHESCLRSYQILSKVKQLLDLKVDPIVIAELIKMMESPISGENIRESWEVWQACAASKDAEIQVNRRLCEALREALRKVMDATPHSMRQDAEAWAEAEHVLAETEAV